jgi:transposase
VPAWRQTGKRDHRVGGADELSLHHLYRATTNGLAQVAWLGREKEDVEKLLFASTRDLLTELDMVFLDTIVRYFEGAGGETLGSHGHSKDHRPDLKQMVVGACLNGNGRLVACEMWPGTSRVRCGPDLTPGNKSDAKALVPAIDRLRKRFGIDRASVVADRGMISKETIADLEERGLGYILGARMRSVNAGRFNARRWSGAMRREVKRDVLSRAGRYRTVAENLRVKEVVVEGRRYVACENPAQAKKDKADREAILASLEDALKKGAKSLVGNRGYRKYLAVERGSVSINRAKAKGEARFDGKFVLRTNVDLPTDEVAMKYKELWRVEQAFRTVKSVLDTRPIYHKCDETIKGHVFASFLALVVMHEFETRLAAKGYMFEWEDVKRDLEALSEVEVFEGEESYWLRTEFAGVASKVFSAIGIAAPPTVRATDA